MRRFGVYMMVLAAALIATPLHAEDRLDVVASFSILADLVRSVGGEHVNVTSLVGPNGDVHVYTPAPQDAKTIADARLVVINGLGLEGWLARLLVSSGSRAPIIAASRSNPAQARLGGRSARLAVRRKHEDLREEHLQRAP